MKRSVKIINLLFLISLYMVEIGPFGSHSIAKLNRGYGTFDMKYYNSSSIKFVLDNMSYKDINVFYKYYICDFIFIIMLFIIQYLLAMRVFKQYGYIRMFKLTVLAFTLRAIFDISENIMLISIINSYPNLNNILICVSSIFTIMKFIMIGIWTIFMVCGLINKIRKNIRRR